jgi:hypothetical protein
MRENPMSWQKLWKEHPKHDRIMEVGPRDGRDLARFSDPLLSRGFDLVVFGRA